MYKEVLAELARKGWTRKDLAVEIEMPYDTLVKKLNGHSELTINEIKRIKKALDTSKSYDELFFA